MAGCWRLCLALCCALACSGHPLEWFTAVVRTEYTEPLTNVTVLNSTESGSYGDHSPKESVQGWLGIPRDPDNMEACQPDSQFTVPGGLPTALDAEDGLPWIALVARGGCTFKEKVLQAARRRASAVVIYNDVKSGNATVPMSHLGTGNTVVIMVWHTKGMEILEPLKRDIPVKMVISVGTRHVQEISGQSVVFVAIAFITMMIISLAWLIFYYVQRFLYTGAQYGNQANRKETKKAISQLQLHRVKKGEKGIDIDAENCAVCIENYKPKDVVRILPCNHIFHRLCIDPWLLEHRTCPMCKLDVIKALGFWVDPEETLDIPVPESMAGSSLSVGTLSVAQEDNRSEANNLLSYSTDDSLSQCNSAKEDAGETTALLGRHMVYVSNSLVKVIQLHLHVVQTCKTAIVAFSNQHKIDLRFLDPQIQLCPIQQDVKSIVCMAVGLCLEDNISEIHDDSGLQDDLKCLGSPEHSASQVKLALRKGCPRIKLHHAPCYAPCSDRRTATSSSQVLGL